MDTVAYVVVSPASAASAAGAAAQGKEEGRYLFSPLAIETLGPSAALGKISSEI